MSSSSKEGASDKITFIGIWKSPNTDNVVNDYDYDNGKYVDYISQSILANRFYEHIMSFGRSIEIPESNLTINDTIHNSEERGITIIEDDKSDKANIKLSHTFCVSELSSIHTDYMIPKVPGCLVMILFEQDREGVYIISMLRFHFEPLFLSEHVNDEYLIEAHLDGLCGNCDNPNIKGAGVVVNIFFDYCEKWNETYTNQIIQYRLEAVHLAFNYWKRKFGFVSDSSDLIENGLVHMTKSVLTSTDEQLEATNLEHPSDPMSVPILTNEDMETIDWAVTWDNLTKGLEQERMHQEEKLNRGMSHAHRQAWGDDFESGGSNKKTKSKKTKSKKTKSKKTKNKKTIQKTKNKKTPRRGRKKPTGSSSI